MNNTKKVICSTLTALLLGANFSCVMANTPDNMYSGSNLIAQNYNQRINSPIEADIRSERLPVGTNIKVRMEGPINTVNSKKGDTFCATIIEDINANGNVLLPAGTEIRGRVAELKSNSFLSRGGYLTLNFDHLITPLGRQIPLVVDVTNSNYINKNGALSAGGGYFNAVSNDLDQGVNIFINTTNFGVKEGIDMGGGAVVVTAPIAVAGGLVGGTGVFLGKSVMAVFQKGNNVKINPGDILQLTLKENLDIPLN